MIDMNINQSMLKTKNMPNEFWAKAVQCVVHSNQKWENMVSVNIIIILAFET